jgi:hypothetical protein
MRAEGDREIETITTISTLLERNIGIAQCSIPLHVRALRKHHQHIRTERKLE